MDPPSNPPVVSNNQQGYSEQFLQNKTMHVNHPEELFGFPNIRMAITQYPESYERTILIDEREYSGFYRETLPRLTSVIELDESENMDDQMVVDDTEMASEGEQEQFLQAGSWTNGPAEPVMERPTIEPLANHGTQENRKFAGHILGPSRQVILIL